jgi:membrane fusion protein (multidrug efflux system)
MERVRPGQEALIKPDIYGGSVVYHGVVEGIVPGTGSVFATLPPDNATGNFIRIVQRVPVRIAIKKEELQETPLRPGLSTVTSINVGGPLNPPNDSIVKTTADEYQTEVYSKDLADARVRAEKIVADNLFKGDGVDAECVVAR